MNFEKRVYNIFKNSNNFKFEKFKSKHWQKFYNKDSFNPEINLFNFRSIDGASKGLDQHYPFETQKLLFEIQKTWKKNLLKII